MPTWYSQHIDTATPTDALPPDEIDDEFRKLKEGLQDYLGANHYCVLGGTAFPSVASGGGMHTQIDFYAPNATPTPGTDQAILYTTDDGGDPELAFIAEGYAERQITLDGALNLIEADFAAVVAGATSILSFDTGELTLELDETTIEYDAVAKLQIKVPVVVDANSGGATVTYDGEYDGTGVANAVEIATGITVREVTVFNTGTNITAVQMLNTGVGSTAKSLTSGDLRTDLAPSVDGFTVTGSAEALNEVANTYRYIAHCVRT